MIRVEDLFIKSGRKKAISFEEFFAAGWDEITYMNYLTKCEVVRSGFTFFRGTGEWIEFFKSFEYHRKNSALHRIKRDSPISCIQEDIVFENTIRYEPIPLDEAKKKIQLLYDSLEELFIWLNQYISFDIGLLDDAVFLLGINVGYQTTGKNHLHHKGITIFYNCDQFRFHLEKLIRHKLQNNGLRREAEFKVCSDDNIDEKIKNNDIKGIPEEVLRTIIFNLEYLCLDVDYADIDNNTLLSYLSLQEWAEKQSENEKLERAYSSIISELEEELKERHIRDCTLINQDVTDIQDKHEYGPGTILYIYAGSVKCLSDHSSLIESVSAEIPSIYDDSIRINAYYCPECKIFFIKQSEYLSYIQKYKYLPVRMKYRNPVKKDADFNREDYSFLSLAGYTVRKESEVPDNIRHMILIRLMEIGVTKHEIITHLDMLIKTNGNRSNMENAKKKWLSDLEFVRDYNINSQRIVPISKIVTGAPDVYYRST